MLVFVDNYQETNLIITDQEIPNTRNIPHFFIFDHFSNGLWEKLLAMIIQEAHKISRYHLYLNSLKKLPFSLI